MWESFRSKLRHPLRRGRRERHASSSELHSEQSVNKAAILYTKHQQPVAEQQVTFLRQNGITGHLVQCYDRTSLTTMDFTQYVRVYLLVDETLYDILMDDERMPENIHVVFREMATTNRRIYVINLFRPNRNEAHRLYGQIPKRAKKYLGDYPSAGSAATGMVSGLNITSTGAAEERLHIDSGMSGGTSVGSTNIGSNNGTINIKHEDGFRLNRGTSGFSYERTESMLRIKTDNADSPDDKIEICIEFSKEYQHILKENVHSGFARREGVIEAKVKFGSIIVELTLERGFVVTEVWLGDVLKSLFNDKLASCMTTGESFSVTVTRYQTIQGDGTPRWYGLYDMATLHENCISKTEVKNYYIPSATLDPPIQGDKPLKPPYQHYITHEHLVASLTKF